MSVLCCRGYWLATDPETRKTHSFFHGSWQIGQSPVLVLLALLWWRRPMVECGAGGTGSARTLLACDVWLVNHHSRNWMKKALNSIWRQNANKLPNVIFKDWFKVVKPSLPGTGPGLGCRRRASVSCREGAWRANGSTICTVRCLLAWTLWTATWQGLLWFTHYAPAPRVQHPIEQDGCIVDEANGRVTDVWSKPLTLPCRSPRIEVVIQFG